MKPTTLHLSLLAASFLLAGCLTTNSAVMRTDLNHDTALQVRFANDSAFGTQKPETIDRLQEFLAKHAEEWKGRSGKLKQPSYSVVIQFAEGEPQILEVFDHGITLVGGRMLRLGLEERRAFDEIVIGSAPYRRFPSIEPES